MTRILRLLAATLATVLAGQAAGVEKPNFVLIFVDDLGYGDLGCYGNTEIATPNLDRLAAEGQRWTDFYAAGPYCVPSRTGLMSGRHPSAVRRPQTDLVPTRDRLLPAMLKQAGYTSAILGKWHLASYPEDFTKAPMHPLECGFDYHFGTPGSNDAPGPPKQTLAAFDQATSETWKIPLIRGREIVEQPADQSLFTKRYTEEAVKWIGANRERPFFLYLAHNMPHVPIFASERFVGKSEGGPYGDVVEEIDWSVGQVIGALKEHGLSERTLVIFTSDNGPWTAFGKRHAGVATPLRGEKSTTWEGGMRVPGIFWWPGTIKPAEVNGIGANLDLYATFAALAGGEEPKDLPAYISTDLSPTLLRGEPSARTQWLYQRVAFRSGNYKLHLSASAPTDPINRGRRPGQKFDPPKLFDLSKDIGESEDIAAEKPEVAARLRREMQAFVDWK